MTGKREKFKQWIDITQGIVLIISLPIALISLHDTSTQTKIQADTLEATRKVESARFVLEIGRDLDTSPYEKVAIAIEGGNDERPHKSTTPILKASGGNIVPREVEDYLGKYNDVGLLLEEGLINEDMAYDEFSYSVEKINCNKDIQKYIADMRHGDSSNDAYYAAIDQLVEVFRKRDHFACPDLDNQ